jgi:uncharacterized protein (DUF4213/DUF364 family)
MGIQEAIRDSAAKNAGETRVEDVRIGLGYTGVLLDNGRMGLAYTFHRGLPGGCSIFRGLRPLRGRLARELIGLLGSPEKVESAVALATCNAVLNGMGGRLKEGDILDHVHLSTEDNICMIGNFAPMVPALKKKAASLKIFEEVEKPVGDILPSKMAAEFFPECQVALISSTSVINNTLDTIFASAVSCREVVLLGASTPLAPEAFQGTPVTLLSGVIITDTQMILNVVSEGGGTRQFRNGAVKVNVRIR